MSAVERAAGVITGRAKLVLAVFLVLTAVLVVYRGFDTFGEIGVVFAAAVAVLAVLGREAVA